MLFITTSLCPTPSMGNDFANNSKVQLYPGVPSLLGQGPDHTPTGLLMCMPHDQPVSQGCCWGRASCARLLRLQNSRLAPHRRSHLERSFPINWAQVFQKLSHPAPSPARGSPGVPAAVPTSHLQTSITKLYRHIPAVRQTLAITQFPSTIQAAGFPAPSFHQLFMGCQTVPIPTSPHSGIIWIISETFSLL